MPKTKTQLIQEFRAKYPNYDAEWRAKNREKLRKQSKAFRERNKEAELTRGQLKYRKYKLAHPEKIKEWYKKNREYPKSKYNVYKKNANNRNIDFSITFEEFMKYWKIDCFYCALPIETIGIDRIDNTKGYTVENIRACCAICNRMKMAQTEKDFIEQCKLIVNNSSERGGL